MARLWPAYLMRHGPFLARLVFSNEKALAKVNWDNTVLPFCRLVTKICWSLRNNTCTCMLPFFFGTNSRQHWDKISDASYELAKTSPLAISLQLFHSKLRTLIFNKSYPDSSSSQRQTPSTITVSLSACLPDSLDLTRCLYILFWISVCE